MTQDVSASRSETQTRDPGPAKAAEIRTPGGRRLSLAAIPGDGIGAEVLPPARAALEAAVGRAVEIRWTEYDLGGRRWLSTQELLPDDTLAQLRQHDALVLGAVGTPAVAPHILERGLLLRLRFELDHHVNVRPARLYEGVDGPLAGRVAGDLDLVVVREGTEGPYAGLGGALRPGTPHEVASEESLNTAFGVRRVVSYAFELARSRPRRRVTFVHKTNVLAHAGALWQRIVDDAAREHPDVEVDYCHVDAATMYLVTDPRRFDVIVTDNLFGDILSDLAAAVSGGIGLAASGNLDTTRQHPSMFEPVHGSAPDIAGRGIADPTAAILSAGLLLDHVGLPDAAERLRAAVTADLAARRSAGTRSTATIGQQIVDRI